MEYGLILIYQKSRGECANREMGDYGIERGIR